MGVLVTKLKCKTCGFAGKAQREPPGGSPSLTGSPSSMGSPPPTGFVYTGEDVASLYRFRCPSCGEDSVYSIAEIKGRFYRTKKVLLYALLVFSTAMMIFRFIHTIFIE
jgi:predicted RNA-binding Zn-ribbon protein involved in translation (DUF1610 family)